MRKTAFYLLIFISVLLLTHVEVVEAVSANALIDHAKGYDGEVVSFKGEVIGDIMKRGDFAWVNISDGVDTIGVWMPTALASKIRFAGDYKHTGDYLEIEGVFHRDCVEHGGELDIHADKLVVLKEGKRRIELVSRAKQKTAIGFLGVALCLGMLKILTERYKKT